MFAMLQMFAKPLAVTTISLRNSDLHSRCKGSAQTRRMVSVRGFLHFHCGGNISVSGGGASSGAQEREGRGKAERGVQFWALFRVPTILPTLEPRRSPLLSLSSHAERRENFVGVMNIKVKVKIWGLPRILLVGSSWVIFKLSKVLLRAVRCQEVDGLGSHQLIPETIEMLS